MSDDFDPYYMWLGVPASEQPPNHYRLLGIELFEDNPDVIENAADRQMAHLRTYQTGKRAELSQQLLNEVAAAKMCLMNPAKKAAYDEVLREAQQSKEQPQARQGGKVKRAVRKTRPRAAAATSGPQAPDDGDAGADASLSSLQSATPSLSPAAATRRRKASKLPLIIGLVSCVCLLTLAAFLFSRGNGDGDGKANPREDDAFLIFNWPPAERADVRLTIDGKAVVLPISGPLEHRCSPGKHHVVATRSRYKEIDQAVTVAAGVRQEVSGTWQPKALLILRWPAESRRVARLEIDNQVVDLTNSVHAADTGQIQLAMEPGAHALRITRDGYQAFQEQFNLALDQRLTVTPMLQPAPTGQGVNLLAMIRPELHSLGDRWTTQGSTLVSPRGANETLLVPYVPPEEYKLTVDVTRRVGHKRLGVGLVAHGRQFCAAIDGWGGTASGLIVRGPNETKRDGPLLIPDQATTLTVTVLKAKVTVAVNGKDLIDWDCDPNRLFLEPGYAVSIKNALFLASHDAEFHITKLELTPITGQGRVLQHTLQAVAAAAGTPVDLLAVSDPAEHAIVGRWRKENGALICALEKAKHARLVPPFELPEEYDVTVVAERQEGTDGLVLGLSAGGRRFGVVFDYWSGQGGYFGAHDIDGRDAKDPLNETSRPGKTFTNGKPATITCQVRKKRLVVKVDGHIIIDWDADYRRCSPRIGLPPGNESKLYVNAWGSSYRITKLEVQPLLPGDSPIPLVKKRRPVPDESARAKALATLKGLYKDAYADDATHARLALAARLIGKASESSEVPVDQYVMLHEARDLAAKAGAASLALVATEKLADAFDVDAWQAKIDTLALTAKGVRDRVAVLSLADSTFALAKDAKDLKQFDSLLPLFRQIVFAASRWAKKQSPVLRQRREAVEELKPLYETAETATAALAQDADDPDGNSNLGLFLCLVKEDWKAGLGHLAKGRSDDPLRSRAARYMEDPRNTDSQVALADAFWDLAAQERRGSVQEKFMRKSARHWYAQALPKIGEPIELAKIRKRLYDAVATPKKRPLQIPLNGLAGQGAMAPDKFSGTIAPGKGFARIGGTCRVDYPAVPTSAYVHEIEVTFARNSGSLTFRYGGAHEAARARLFWHADKQTLLIRMDHHVRGIVYWGRGVTFKPGERVRLTMYANENYFRLFKEGQPGSIGTGSLPQDLRLSIFSSTDTNAVIHRCALRPWTSADAALTRRAMPPGRISADIAAAAQRFHERNFGLTDRPDLMQPEPFVVYSTGTPMQWAKPGSFQRMQKGGSTEVSLTRGFWIGRYELTQQEWGHLAEANPSRITGSPYLPLSSVSWDDAVKFCVLLTQSEKKARRLLKGYEYRLPTEAEWEYACRAGSKEQHSVDRDGFWYFNNSRSGPREVGEGKANAWGLYDMHGNVFEWCYDGWRDPPEFPPERLTDPFTRRNGPKDHLVARGGAWWAQLQTCYSTARRRHGPDIDVHVGFRVVLAPVLGR